jgi:hypothetical protein
MRRVIIGAVVVLFVVAVIGGVSATRSDTSDAGTVPGTRCPTATVNQLVAQTVPTASLVPCVSAFGTRWSVDGEDYTSDGTSVSMTGHDSEDVTWKVGLVSECETDGLTTAGSDGSGAEVWQSDEQTDSMSTSTKTFVFDGGCVTSVVGFPTRFDRALVLGDVDEMLQLVPRSALNDQVIARTDGALSLDPPE